MKKGTKVIIKATNELATIFFATTTLEEPFYFLNTKKDRFSIHEYSKNDFTELSDIAILDEEYKKEGSDLLCIAEDSEGNIFEILIPIVEIEDFFEIEEIRFDEEIDFAFAAQSVYDMWTQSPKDYDIEIKFAS